MHSRFCIVCDKPFGLEGPYDSVIFGESRFDVCCPMCKKQFKSDKVRYAQRFQLESSKHRSRSIKENYLHDDQGSKTNVIKGDISSEPDKF